jgi:hypothetical protein
MSNSILTGIFATHDDHGCAYTVDTEGTLYYTPLRVDGSINTEDVSEVDFYDAIDNDMLPIVESIHDQLIEMMRIAGLYFQV